MTHRGVVHEVVGRLRARAAGTPGLAGRLAGDRTPARNGGRADGPGERRSHRRRTGARAAARRTRRSHWSADASLPQQRRVDTTLEGLAEAVSRLGHRSAGADRGRAGHPALTTPADRRRLPVHWPNVSACGRAGFVCRCDVGPYPHVGFPSGPGGTSPRRPRPRHQRGVSSARSSSRRHPILNRRRVRRQLSPRGLSAVSVLLGSGAPATTRMPRDVHDSTRSRARRPSRTAATPPPGQAQRRASGRSASVSRSTATSRTRPTTTA